MGFPSIFYVVVLVGDSPVTRVASRDYTGGQAARSRLIGGLARWV
jgi:hypothetical protein